MKKTLFAFIIGTLTISNFIHSGLATRFSDVSMQDWFYNSVTELTEEGVIKGYKDSTFKASNSVNRAELAVIIDRNNKSQQKKQVSQEQVFQLLSKSNEFSDLQINYENQYFSDNEIKSALYFAEAGLNTSNESEYLNEIIKDKTVNPFFYKIEGTGLAKEYSVYIDGSEAAIDGPAYLYLLFEGTRESKGEFMPSAEKTWFGPF